MSKRRKGKDAEEKEVQKDDLPVLAKLPNGNYPIPKKLSAVDINISSGKGNNVVFGLYFSDSKGNPISGSIIFCDLDASFPGGSEVDIRLKKSSLPPQATQVGFFCIPNDNNLYSGFRDGEKVTFGQNSAGDWIAYVGENSQCTRGIPVCFPIKCPEPNNDDSSNQDNAGAQNNCEIMGSEIDLETLLT